jgi:hypothetical protein
MDQRKDLPELIGRLAGSISTFIEAKLGLLRLEVEVRLRAHARRVLLYVAGACLVLTALLIASVAMGFGISALLQSRIPSGEARHALAFAIVAFVETAGAAALVWTARRLGAAHAARPADPEADRSEAPLVLHTRKTS